MAFSPGTNTVGFAQDVSYPIPASNLGQTRNVYHWELMCDMMMQDIRIMARHMKMMRMECVRQRLERQQILAQCARDQGSPESVEPAPAETSESRLDMRG